MTNKFSQRLKELRESKGISQFEFAKILNFTQPAVSRWESGERSPSLDNLISIAEYFQVSTDYLLGVVDL